MIWIVSLIVSLICLIGSIVLAITQSKGRRKRLKFLDASKILLLGVVLSSGVLFVPVYMNELIASDCGLLEVLLLSIHNVIRLFIVDGEFSFITSNLVGIPEYMYKCYTVLFSILFVFAPVLTFGFVLTFFKNVSAYRRYITHYNSDIFIFSELNEKSLTLAESLYKNDRKKRFFVFTDVYEKEEEEISELIEKLKEIGAIYFKKDIAAINFSFHNKKSNLNFFIIGEDQNENITQSLTIIDKFKSRENTNLYLFSTLVEAELLLTKAFTGCEKEENDKAAPIKIKVRRVNEVRSLIARNLYENGFEKIFSSAVKSEDGIKRINAVVVGMGKHGTEMTKALSWFCQMTGFVVNIDSFDVGSDAEQRFVSACPELMKFSGKLDISGEAKYTINIHNKTNVATADFENCVLNLPQTTYVFVALGNDEKNISTAIRLRQIFERKGISPEIQAIVCNTDKKEALEGISNFKGQKYNIDFIGDIRSSYSEEVILHSDVENKALERHLKWGKEADFWQYDYNYRSSIASAIHHKMKVLCGIPGADKAPDERTQEELVALRILEHCRWNAYMRSEGYVYGGTVEKSGRNDLAKMHNCLVPFDELPLSEQEKDDD